MIYSGLDWSGSPGLAHGPWLVFAVVHFDEAGIAKLDGELAVVEQRLRLPPSCVFRHNGSSMPARDAFFSAIGRVSLTGHVHMLAKAEWTARQIGKPSGPDCIREGIVTLIEACPDAVVARMVLYLDLPPQEERAIAHYRTEIRKALRVARPQRTGFKNGRPCPDHRLHGAIIQVADMIAGEVRERGGLSGPYLSRLGTRIRLV